MVSKWFWNDVHHREKCGSRTATTAGVQQEYCWNQLEHCSSTPGIQLESWSSASVVLDCCTSTAGVLQDYCWTTAGLLLDYCWTFAGLLLESLCTQQYSGSGPAESNSGSAVILQDYCWTPAGPLRNAAPLLRLAPFYGGTLGNTDLSRQRYLQNWGRFPIVILKWMICI